MRVELKIVDGIVIDSKFKTFGCGSAIASSSLATEWVKGIFLVFSFLIGQGKTIEECLQIKNSEIASYLALPPVKLHCSMLAEDAIRAAIFNYQQQHKNEAQEARE